ncbi:MAG: methionyl aminopeptidase [SAR324 cluster bacterium]|nr:methionyl aminopeptidase [SAR324 cluster bacterium]MCZ6626650.1 methionyl aminopeptidase [SAR324 cluster bacterium]
MKETTGNKRPGRNDPCWCGSGRKYKKCHMMADKREKPPAWGMGHVGDTSGHHVNTSLIKSKAQIEGIRKAGRLNKRILDMLEERIREGVTTIQIDQWVHELTVANNGVPAPLNYKQFPKSVCTSVNEVVCHGIPEKRKLLSGDIMNVDVTSILQGYYGDSSRMFMIGEVSPEARKLVQVTKECLEIGIAQVKPGGFVGDIGSAIQDYAEQRGYSVVRDFVGHGTGLRFHEDPQIPHFGQKGKGHPFLPGMVFTIEPMINAGHYATTILKDGWTAVTRDGSLSAQWEHTLAVTSDGVDVLTA